MKPLDADFLKRCESLHLAAQNTWGQRFLARRVELQLAGGTEVTGYADYASGDDFRYVDWYRCARHDELVCKQFQGNEDLSTYLLLDCSASMRWGDGAKFDLARQLTAALGFLALANLDRVGVLTFADGIVSELPPARSRTHVPRLLNFLDEIPQHTAPTNLKKSIESFLHRSFRPGLVVVISDLFDSAGYADAIDILRRRHYEPYVLHVFDKSDAEPQLLGRHRLRDAETQRMVRQDVDETDLANYRKVFREFSDSLRRYCSRHSISLTQTRADVPLEQCVRQMIMRAVQR